MTRQMTATDMKAKILSLLDEVANGEEIEITKRSAPSPAWSRRPVRHH